MSVKEKIMENKKINVVSMVRGRVGVNLPHLRFQREWPTMGTIIPVDMDILKEAIFDPGFSNMIKSGILLIDNMEAKVALGLEPETATKPENIITFNEQQLIKLLKVSNIEDFEETIKKMSKIQLETLSQLAISKQIMDFDKTDLIKKYSGIDVRKAIELSRQNKEE